MSQTRLYRTVQGRVIGGVAGGLADYFGMDPTIVRLIFVLLVIFGGSGVLLYIILWIILPEKNNYSTFTSYTSNAPPPPTGETSGIGDAYDGFEQGKPYNTENEIYNKITEARQKKKMEGSLIGGAILIVLGSIFLIEKFIPRIDFGDLWPILLISLGLILIFGNLPRKNNYDSNPNTGEPDKKDDQQTS